MPNQNMKLMYECTIEGFINDFNTAQFGNDIDTINNAIAYILKHGMHNDYTKCDIKELIFTAKNEVAKSVARKQLASNPKDLSNMQANNKEDNEEIRQFLADPLKYMAGKIKDEFYVDMIHYDDPRMDPKEKEQYRIDYFLSAKNHAFDFEDERWIEQYKEYERNVGKTQKFTANLSAKLAANDSTISASFTKQKAGFFEKLFNTTSEEYSNFKSAYANYKNPDHELYGNDEYLKDAAMGYLKHKFPNLKKDELPTEEQIAKLGGAGKERALFCLNVVKTYDETHDLQEQADKIVKEAELYTNFKKIYAKFIDQDESFEEKDGDELENSAKAYLKYKFPSLKEGELPTDEQIETLQGDAKEVATLCVQSLKDYLDIDDDSLSIDNGNQAAQYKFENKLEKDVDLENKNINDNNIIQDENVSENELDNSK